MNGVRFPGGWAIETLCKVHNRRSFNSGNEDVNRWRNQSTLQSQNKHLSSSKVLVDDQRAFVGYYSLAISQVDFSEPHETVHLVPNA